MIFCRASAVVHWSQYTYWNVPVFTVPVRRVHGGTTRAVAERGARSVSSTSRRSQYTVPVVRRANSTIPVQRMLRATGTVRTYRNHYTYTVQTYGTTT